MLFRSVENIDDGEFAGLNRQPRDIDLAAKLEGAAGEPTGIIEHTEST